MNEHQEKPQENGHRGPKEAEVERDSQENKMCSEIL